MHIIRGTCIRGFVWLCVYICVSTLGNLINTITITTIDHTTKQLYYRVCEINNQNSKVKQSPCFFRILLYLFLSKDILSTWIQRWPRRTNIDPSSRVMDECVSENSQSKFLEHTNEYRISNQVFTAAYLTWLCNEKSNFLAVDFGDLIEPLYKL